MPTSLQTCLHLSSPDQAVALKRNSLFQTTRGQTEVDSVFYVIDARCSIAVKGRTFNGKLHHHLVANAYILPGRVYECVCVYVNSSIYVLCLCSMEETETLLFVVQPCVVQWRKNLVTFVELQVVILAGFHRVYCNTTLPRLTIAVPLRRKALISSICQSLNHVDCHWFVNRSRTLFAQSCE